MSKQKAFNLWDNLETLNECFNNTEAGSQLEYAQEDIETLQREVAQLRANQKQLTEVLVALICGERFSIEKIRDFGVESYRFKPVRDDGCDTPPLKTRFGKELPN